jgi:lycopene cyclase domain-containing protein
MTRYTYLFVDLLAVFIPLIFSFHPKIKFYKKWNLVLPALFATAIFFIAWDILFTHWKVWSFNPEYLMGIYFFNLPIEELLFFLCIPYACIFTYFSIGLLKKISFIGRSKTISSGIIILLFFLIVIYFHRLYTSVTFILLILLIFYNEFIKRFKWINKFYFSYLILLIPFFICNGILTGTGLDKAVVKYNEKEIIGFRILTIPVEDIFYGMLMIMMSVTIFEYLIRRKRRME